jgi:TonB-linked SusC/RagA family outer membrane protein
MTKLFTIAFTFLCLSMSLLLASNGNAQVKSIEEVSVYLTLHEVSVAKAFKELEKKTQYGFVFASREIRGLPLISFESSGESLYEVLTVIAIQTNLTFKQIDENIHVKREEKLPEIIVNADDEITVSGRVFDENGEPMPGATITVSGTSAGTISDLEGMYSITVSEGAVLVFSYIGYESFTVQVGNQSVIDVTLTPDLSSLDEVVVVGYGVQKRSDITGSVASIPQERLEMVPNVNIAQAIQGAIPGVMVQNTSAGAKPSQNIMVRGRNSIHASNDPLIVVDGVPYGGNISDLNPNEVESIEVLKDASAAAIYGSRGSNGVILITTKTGAAGETKISYDGYYSIQSYANLPRPLTGPEFYDFKESRFPGQITLTEQEVYDSGDWVNWLDLGLRNGYGQQHNLAASGGVNRTNYFIGLGLTDIQGLPINDDYLRITTRFNVDTRIADWITLGTRTQLSYEDTSGDSPSMSGLWFHNPLARPFNEDGSQALIPWPENNEGNPLQATLFDNQSNSYQIVTNNYVIMDLPFVPGLSYRLNTGVRFTFWDDATYRGRNTLTGLFAGGSSNTSRRQHNNYVVENILSYNRDFGSHSIFATGVASFEQNKFSGQSTTASQFPHDFLTYYSIAQAEIVNNSYSYNETNLISQMLRVNYSYGDRYLLTLTGRRDGYSGFGAGSKWGVFPSVAIGWNLINESFFRWDDLFSNLKLRASWGLNGNQAVSAYESISRLTSDDYIDRGVTLAGYRPSRLGQDNLGWESSQTLNFGLDFGFLNDRITGDLNIYKIRTSDLLLNRSISAVHGITSITQNIGVTMNKGFEVGFHSRNIVSQDGGFTWSTTANLSYVQNRIVSLYGFLDEQGREIDDVANAWFIGQPIRVNHDFKWLGVWQLDEADEAAEWNSQPGFVKLEDTNGDGILDARDRQILGQQDPKYLWGITNSFTYANFRLDIFIHGVHGVTRNLFPYMTDLETFSVIRRNTFRKNWWTPENPTNDFVMNHLNAEYMSGIRGFMYEDASFIRVKDITLSHDFSNLANKIGVEKLRLYATGRNLATFTNWRGLDPELDSQINTPLQREFVFGVNLGF